MASFQTLISALKSKPQKEKDEDRIPDPPPPLIIPYKPVLIHYQLKLMVEGKMLINLVEPLLCSLYLSFIYDLFVKSPGWTGVSGYLWKSMLKKTLGTLSVQTSEKGVCYLLTTTLNVKGFTEGSCVPETVADKMIDGSRSWEMHIDQDHLVIISIRYYIKLRTFNHYGRDAVRNNGFQCLDCPTKKEKEMYKYLEKKMTSPTYTHERGLIKMIGKTKVPKPSRIKALIHKHKEENTIIPSAPPAYDSDSASDEWSD